MKKLMELNTALHVESFEHLVVTLERFVAMGRKNKPTEAVMNARARIVGHALWDLPQIYSDRASEVGLVALYNRRINKLTPEHMWPRLLSGEALIKTFTRDGKVDRKKLLKLLTKYCTVNRTHPEENTALRKFQESNVFQTPELAYKNAGIKLVDWPKGTLIDQLLVRFPRLKSYVRKDARKGRK